MGYLPGLVVRVVTVTGACSESHQFMERRFGEGMPRHEAHPLHTPHLGGNGQMAMNLVQHRGAPNVWERAEANWDWDTERWLVAVLAGAFLVAGFRRRSIAGFALAVGGASLAWWAAAGVDERRIRRGRMRAVLPSGGGNADTVHEASEESFPASDAPSWTPSTGNTGPAGTRAH